MICFWALHLLVKSTPTFLHYVEIIIGMKTSSWATFVKFTQFIHARSSFQKGVFELLLASSVSSQAVIPNMRQFRICTQRTQSRLHSQFHSSSLCSRCIALFRFFDADQLYKAFGVKKRMHRKSTLRRRDFCDLNLSIHSYSPRLKFDFHGVKTYFNCQ